MADIREQVAGRVTAAGLYQVLRSVGATEPEAELLSAIALAESGGNYGARGDLNLVSAKWGPSIGAWQIRTLNADRGSGRFRDELALNGNASFQARAALHIKRNEGGYQAWTVYKTGKYGEFLPVVRAARDGMNNEQDGASTGLGGQLAGTVGGVGGAVVGAAGGVLSGIDAVGSFLGMLAKRGTWVRVTQVGGGGVFIVLGLVLLGKDIAKPAVDVLTDLNPAARTAKAAARVTKEASS